MSKAKEQPVLVMITSDHHAGSTVGVCPPEGVRLDDGGTYTPSRPQQWLWDCWEDVNKQVRALRQASGASLRIVYNGDMVDGDHHHTHQIILRNPDAQHYVASRVFGVPLLGYKTGRDKTYVVRGTEAHVGSGGSAEEAIAKMLLAEKDTETETWSRWRLRMEVHGVLFDFQHHGKIGQTPWTKTNVVNSNAARIFLEHAQRGLRHPDLAFRSHMHQYADSFEAQPTRLIQTPSFQLKTGFVHKVAPESIADVGGIAVLVEPNGKYTIEKMLYTPKLPEVVK